MQVSKALHSDVAHALACCGELQFAADLSASADSCPLKRAPRKLT